LRLFRASKLRFVSPFLKRRLGYRYQGYAVFAGAQWQVFVDPEFQECDKEADLQLGSEFNFPV